MPDNLLAIVQKACARIGALDIPTAAFGATDDITTTMLALAQEEGEDLVRAGDWSVLTVGAGTIALVAGQDTYALPPDFDRLVGDTTWDRANQWRTEGPDDPQTARWRRESALAETARRAIRQVGGGVSVWPVPGPGDVGAIISFSYVSNAFCASAAGVPQSAWASDADQPILRADLFILGLKWRWRDAKGFDATVARQDYERAVRLALARDKGGGETIDLSGRGCRGRGNADGVTAGPAVVVSQQNP